MPDLGYYTVPVILSFEGTAGKVKRQLGSQFQALGRDGGRQMGKAAGDAFSRDKSIEKAASSKAKALDSLKVATSKVAQAQASLTQAEARGNIAGRARAVEAVTQARVKEAAAIRDVQAATKGLESATKQAQTQAAHVAAQAAGDGGGGGMLGLMLLGSRGSAGLTSMASSAGGAMGLAAKAGIAGVLTAGAGAAIIAPFVAGFKLFDWAAEVGLPLERVLNNLKGVTGASAQEMAAIGTQARALGSDISLAGTTASDAAQGMLELTKSGFTVQQALDASRATVQLATAAQIDAGRAAEIVGTAINTFGLKASDAQTVVDDFAATVLGSAADVPDLSLALSQAGAVASGFGISLQDTLATLGTFAQMGIKSSDAGTLMKTSLLAWTSATEPQAQAMDALNLSLSDSEGNFVGYRSMLEQLSTASKNMTQMEFNSAAATLFGSDAVRAGMLARGEAIPTFDRLKTEIAKEGQASRMAGAQMEGLPGVVEGASNAMDGLKLSVYDAGSAIATALGKEGLSVFDEFSTWVKTHQPEMVGFFTGLATAAISGMADMVHAIELGADALAGIVNLVGDTLGGIQRAYAASQRLLGRDEEADKADRLADSMFGWSDGLEKFVDKAGDARRRLEELQGRVQTAGDKANDAAKATRDQALALAALGGATKDATEETDKQTTAVDELGNAIKRLPPQQDSILNITDATGAPIPFAQILTGGVTIPGIGIPGNNPLGAISGPSGPGGLPGGVTAPGGGGVPGQNPLGALTPSGAGPKAAVHQALLGAGYPESEWAALQQLIQGESGWNPSARNPSSGAFGLFQFLGHENDKYGQLGGYSTNPAQQAVAGLQYIKDRYGTPSAALAFWNAQSPHWYGTGGNVTGPNGRDRVPAWLTAGEFVVNKDSASKFLPLLRGINGFENGGLVPEVQQVQQIASQFGLTLSSGRRDEPGSFHNTGMAGDFSNGVRTDQMLAFATYMAQTYGANLAELIYDDPRFSMEIDEGKIVSRAFFAAAGDHTNHVHVAVRSGSGGGVTGSGSLGAGGGLNMPTITTGGMGATSAFGAGFQPGPAGSTAGYNEYGEPGYYAPDPRRLREAEQAVRDADAKVRIQEQQIIELKKDASESQRMAAEDEARRAREDAADARADLEEAKRGDFTAAREATTSGRGAGAERGGSPALGELGSIASSFFKDTFGFGSMFPDLANLMPVQMAGTLIDSAMSIASGIGSGQWQINPNGLPLLQQTGTSNAPFGIPDVTAPGAPPGLGGAAGAAPGPTIINNNLDASQNFKNSPLGISPADMERKQLERFSRALPRIPVGR